MASVKEQRRSSSKVNLRNVVFRYYLIFCMNEAFVQSNDREGSESVVLKVMHVLASRIY